MTVTVCVFLIVGMFCGPLAWPGTKMTLSCVVFERGVGNTSDVWSGEWKSTGNFYRYIFGFGAIQVDCVLANIYKCDFDFSFKPQIFDRQQCKRLTLNN